MSPFGSAPADPTPDDLAGGAAALRRDLPRLGVTPPAAALDELVGLPGARHGGSGLVPRGHCPDNAVDEPDGVVLLDVEAACHRHVAWEGAYLTVPWPTCWCSWRLPDEVTARAVASWRTALARPAAEPAFASDLVLDDDRLGAPLHCVAAARRPRRRPAGTRNPAVMGGDGSPRHDPASAGARGRARDARPAGSASAGGAVHAATLAAWGRCELDLAPAFR